MFSGGEIYESPVLEEAMNADNEGHVADEVPSAVSSRKVFFHVLQPHSHHSVPVVFVEFGILVADGEGKVLLGRCKELRKGLFLDGMDFF